MTPRSIRRAAERKALKLARKAERLTSERPSELAEASAASIAGSTPSETRLAANRANAQLSTGPTTAEGKAKSSLNAVTNALTGRTVLLPSDDRDRYEQHVQSFFRDCQPIGPRECELTQSLADIAWRLARITTLEMALYANGRNEFVGLVENDSPEARPALLDMHTFLHYERQLRNLSTQESRLLRQREKQTAELKQLQEDRVKQEREQREMAAKLYLAARKDRRPFHPEELGFDFSIDDIEDYIAGARAAASAREALPASSEGQTHQVQAA